jgi:glycosyltransferase involved in cell wall biosynthesis
MKTAATNASGQPVIGWIGSSTTLPYLKALRHVFEKLQVIPRVIASGDPAILGFSVDFRPWRLESELAELAQLDIGIAPLPDTAWEKGKCGVKLLQYMACGMPVVASPVGVHNAIVRHGVNGFLARDTVEWCEYLGELVGNAKVRGRLGAAGRGTVEKSYDIHLAAEKVAAVLMNTAAAHPFEPRAQSANR